MTPEKLALYCLCGASAVGTGDSGFVLDIRAAFTLIHSGDGHGETDKRTAANARRREERRYMRELRQA